MNEEEQQTTPVQVWGGRLVRNGLPALLTLEFLYFTVNRFQWEVSKILLLSQLVLLATFFLFRTDPVKVSWRPDHVFVALFGTFGPFILGFFVRVPSLELPIALVLQALGVGLSLVAMLSLNFSFGVLPANRGVKTGGLYQFVRHPIYSAYQLQQIGYFINQPTVTAGVIVGLTLTAQILRIIAEESVLSEDPAYRDYKAQVRYRLIPLIW